MPVDTSGATARLVELLDKILTTVRSWPTREVGKNATTMRRIPAGGIGEFQDLDAKIGVEAHLLGITIPSPPDGHVSTRQYGYTKLAIISSTDTDYTDEWERRIEALKNSMQAAIEAESPRGGHTEMNAPASGGDALALNWLQARFLESDDEQVVVPKEQFHAHLLSVSLPVQSTVDRCKTAGWIEDSRAIKPGTPAVKSVGTFSAHVASQIARRLPLPSVQGYRILEAVQLATATSDAGGAAGRKEPVRASAPKIFPKGELDNRDVAELAIRINTEKDSGNSWNQIALKYTKGDRRRADSLLASLRRLRGQGRVNL